MTGNKIISTLAKVISILFHPLLIPTLGFFLLFISGFYFSILPWNFKQYIMMVVFGSTCLLPAVSIWLLSFSQKFDIKMEKNTDRVMPLMITSVFYYSGYLILKKLPVFPIYNLFIIASILVQIALLLISLRWKISAHLAAIGGLLGGFMGLSFRLQENPVHILIFLILVTGALGTARLILGKHTRAQIYAGFMLGFLIMNGVFLFI